MKKIMAYVDGAIHFDYRQIPPEILDELREGLAFPNPKFESAMRYGRDEGDIAPEICLLEVTEKAASFPRGAVKLFRDLLHAEGIGVEFYDGRVLCSEVSYDFQLELRDYQRSAIQALVRGVHGYVVSPCGSGKTIMGAGAIAHVRQPTLVLVHTQDLLEQWRQMGRDVLGLEVGEISGGVINPSTVTVATVQSLSKLDYEVKFRLAARFGALIIDEAHHTPANSFREVLGWLPAKYRFGLTATPERDDGLTPLLHLCIGPEAYRIRHETLIEAGHLVIPEVVPVWTGTHVRSQRHTDCVRELSENPVRNDNILELVAEEAQSGRSVLVLSGLRDHCEALSEQLGTQAAALTSRVPKKKRPDVLERFRDRSLKVICATSLADEGLDVTCLERLVLATPARSEGRTTQRMGRLMRPRADKAPPKLYDLVDEYSLAYNQFESRKKAYAKVLGQHILELGQKDGLHWRIARTLGTNTHRVAV